MADELKCCPFCSGDGAPATVRYSRETVDEQGWGQSEYHYVSCVSCGANNCGIVGHRTPERAAEHWNRRAPLPRADNPPGEGVVVLPIGPLEPWQIQPEDDNPGLWLLCRTREERDAILRFCTAPRPAAPGDGEEEKTVASVVRQLRHMAELPTAQEAINGRAAIHAAAHAIEVKWGLLSTSPDALAPPVQARGGDEVERIELRERAQEMCERMRLDFGIRVPPRFHTWLTQCLAEVVGNDDPALTRAALAPSAARDEQTGGGR